MQELDYICAEIFGIIAPILFIGSIICIWMQCGDDNPYKDWGKYMKK